MYISVTDDPASEGVSPMTMIDGDDDVAASLESENSAIQIHPAKMHNNLELLRHEYIHGVLCQGWILKKNVSFVKKVTRSSVNQRQFEKNEQVLPKIAINPAGCTLRNLYWQFKIQYVIGTTHLLSNPT